MRSGAKNRRFHLITVFLVCLLISSIMLPSSLYAASSVVAWGSNSNGESNVPLPNMSFTAIAAGNFHSLGLLDGSIVAWGSNSYNQCVVPSPNTDFTAIAAGASHSLGLKNDGSIVAWGRNDYTQCNVPSPNTGFTSVAGGWYHSLGLKSDGSIVVWGRNDYGQCNVPSPNTGFIAIAANGHHSLGLKADGSIVAWGRNQYGQCNVPSPNTGFTAVAAGDYHSLGLKNDGSIIAWGYNAKGQCTIPSPNTGFTAITAGSSHSLGLKNNGSIAAWGRNDSGECTVPLPNTGFTAISASGYHSLGMKTRTANIIFYVDANSTTEPKLGTQTKPYRSIQDCIDATIAGDQVHVAAGVYNELLTITNDVYLYGGYYSSDWNATRDCNANKTIIDGRGLHGSLVYVEDANVIIDGFTITHGSANGASGANGYTDLNGNGVDGGDGEDGYGGGMYCKNSNITIIDCTFSNNSATGGSGGHFGSMDPWDYEHYNGNGGSGASGYGGGIFCTNSRPIIKKCTLINNIAYGGNSGGGYVAGGHGDSFVGYVGHGSGGGIYCDYYCDAIISNCIFINNNVIGGNSGYGVSENNNNGGSGSGGGIYSDGGLAIANCAFNGNSAMGGIGGSNWLIDSGYGGSAAGGGLYSNNGQSVVNCIFFDNTAEGGVGGDGDGGPAFGGGLCSYSQAVSNCTFHNNAAIGGLSGYWGYDGMAYGGGILSNSNQVLTNLILWANLPDQLFGQDCNNVRYCDISDGTCSGQNGNISIDPCFADPNYRLQCGSACIDAGNPASNFSNEPHPNGNRINIGAYGNTADAEISCLDSDKDGISNPLEILWGLNPDSNDTDNDGLPDYYEVCYDGDCNDYKPHPNGGDLNAVSNDTDSDGMPDGWEVANGLNAMVNDAGDDLDNDGYPNLLEFLRNSLPNNPNSQPAMIIIYVDDDAPNDPGTGTQGDPFRRIQDGINVAIAGDEVLVAAGMYNELVTITNDVNLYGGYDGSNWNATSNPTANETIINGGVDVVDVNVTIDGFTIQYGGPGIYCSSSNNTAFTVRISNNIIQNNYSLDYGGGIYCGSSVKPVITGNVIRNNEAMAGGYTYTHEAGGGGIFCAGTDCQITGNTVVDNEVLIGYDASYNYAAGGGMWVGGGLISDNIISQNYVWSLSNHYYDTAGAGGGIYCDGPATITKNIIKNNICNADGGDTYVLSFGLSGIATGGGIYANGSYIANNVVVNNRVTGTGGDGGYEWFQHPGEYTLGGIGVAIGGGIYTYGGTIVNNTVAGNYTYSEDGTGYIAIDCNYWPYYEIVPYQGHGYWGTSSSAGSGICGGNISNTIIWNNFPDQNESVDPLFADPNNGDYHLKSAYGRWNPNSQTWMFDDVNSPCIDAGNPTDSNWTKEPWPNGKRIDMGAYGGTSEASLSGTGNSFNFEDYAIYANEWTGGNSYTIPKGNVTVDGNLSEWSGNVEWIKLDKIYSSDPCDIFEARFALRWSPATNKIYVAVIVEDTKHVFRNDYGTWSASDRVEVYSQGNAAGGSYTELEDIAQQYMIGPNTSGGSWATFGDGNSNIGGTGLEYVVKVSGDFIIYEIGAKQFDNYGGLSGGPTIVTALDVNDVVRFDVVADTRWSPTGFGMLSENLMASKAWYADKFAIYRLVEDSNMPGCLDLKGDLDRNCVFDFKDIQIFCENWLEAVE